MTTINGLEIECGCAVVVNEEWRDLLLVRTTTIYITVYQRDFSGFDLIQEIIHDGKTYTGFTTQNTKSIRDGFWQHKTMRGFMSLVSDDFIDQLTSRNEYEWHDTFSTYAIELIKEEIIMNSYGN